MEIMLQVFVWVNLVLAKVHRFNWDITEKEISPDKFTIRSIVINGQLPGPPINAIVGDQIIVKVNNKLTRGFTIHWHGIKQLGNVKMDGVPHITQLPISPGQSYTYDFKADVAGTFWYHAHSGMDSEQAYGALIVKDTDETWQSIVDFDSVYSYDEERTLLLTEWWHETPEEVRKKLISLPFSGVDGANSHLINGRCLDSKKGPYTLNVEAGKKYRLRLIGATGLSMFRFRIKGHRFTVIEVEGTLVKPVEVDHIDVNSGERYSVILRANQPINSYVGSISTPLEEMITNNGVFVLKYKGAATPTNFTREAISYSRNRFIESQLISSKWYDTHKSPHYYKPPLSVDKEIFISTHLASNNGLPVHTMNEVMPTNRSGVLWEEIQQGRFKPDGHSYNVTQGQNVQIIIEDLVYSGRSCRVHPWHLHGHSFHVVAHGQGFYNPNTDQAIIDRALQSRPSPILRDTFSLYTTDMKTESNFQGRETPGDLGPMSNGPAKNYKPCGWYALRFKADNPGSWLLHCHITHHVIMGMVTVINVHP
ncbi:hypothetical protein DSO57_1013024 [Entomophthora muscae]|uniref:Uncharacterized protein n=1 Tax=Entomophthora muscae TaxID=34485 RepID=A0ACC2RKS0_9FUNG|nr:hypothetical protein DSO57_1013024 [Entomophthora muscae]